MANKFDGITEKLKRTNENIRDLESEITTFFQEGKYTTLPKDDNKFLLEAIEYHQRRPIPLRFSVLAGEIVHHLRSCLDHIVWTFSTDTYRKSHFRYIEFPVCERKPVDKNSIAGYERKVKGITNSTVRKLIKDIQPYNAPDPIESTILIIHNMDIVDKHRELVLGVSTGSCEVPTELVRRYAGYKRGVAGSTPVDLVAELKSNLKVVPQISFRNFGRREIHPIVPALIELHNSIVHIASVFERELPLA